MILWVILFFIIVAISFVLAYLSMKDYADIPKSESYSTFLIQNVPALTADLLDALRNEAKADSTIVSIERLFKGPRSALVIFTHKSLIAKYPALNSLELEDYTKINDSNVTAWEVVKKEDPTASIFSKLPNLDESEQFWFQQTLQPKGDKWQAEMRVVYYGVNSDLAKTLQSVTEPSVIKIPRPLTSKQIFESYAKRSLVPANSANELTSKEVIQLLS
jgi:hypothetical protein